MAYSFAELLILGRVIPDVLPDDEEEEGSLKEDLEDTCACPVQGSGPVLVFDDMEI